MEEEGNWFVRDGNTLENCYTFWREEVSGYRIVGKKVLFINVFSFVSLSIFFTAGYKIQLETREKI
jgi:hypothetical protein